MDRKPIIADDFRQMKALCEHKSLTCCSCCIIENNGMVFRTNIRSYLFLLADVLAVLHLYSIGVTLMEM